MTETEALQKRFVAALMPNYGVPPLAISRGQGCRLWDADGRRYLDLIAGIAVSSLGHAHPAIVEAVSRQVAEVAHTSNLFLHEREVELAERLLTLLAEDGRVFFANSGTEANEAAVKLVVLTDVAGLYRDGPSSADVISELTAAELERLLPGLSAGMLPKMEACLTAVRGGVPQAHVLDGRLSHAVLLEIFTDSGIGTMVLQEKVIPPTPPLPGGTR
jgi:hypothetical protein